MQRFPRHRVLALTMVAACASTPGTGPASGGGGGGEGGGSGTQQDPQPQPASEGPYHVTSTVDLTVEAILPAQAEIAVATLREFSTNPAHAMVDLASREGVPAVGLIYGVLPSALTDPLESWINGEIAKVKINGQPVTAFAGDIAALADTALTKFAVDSQLAIDGSTATHTLTAIDFSPAGLDAKLPIGGFAADLLTQHPSISVGSAGALAIGDEHFGLEFGQYAWQAVEAGCKATFGNDVRTTLGKAINCPNLAHNIANKCVLFACVGHETELTGLCTGGLDAVVNLAHDAIVSFRIDAFHFASGTATLVDDDGDGVADRIVDGTWTAEMNLGMGLRHTPATFTATR